MFKIKKVVLMISVVLMTVNMGISAFAYEVHNEMQGVSTRPPVESIITPDGLDKPGTDKYVNLNDGELTFSGSAGRSTLYTNKHFKGKSSIEYSITNDCDKKLTVKFYTSSGWFKSKAITVEANATLTGTIDGLDKDKLYYLTFSAPSDFNGSIY